MKSNVVKLSPDTFDEFWKACPRKIGKMQTRALWDQITGHGFETRNQNRDSGLYIQVSIKKTDPQKIIDGMKRYKRRVWGLSDDAETEEKYILHPATWLNRAGWEDG